MLLKEHPDLSKKFIHRIDVVAIADIDERITPYTMAILTGRIDSIPVATKTTCTA